MRLGPDRHFLQGGERPADCIVAFDRRYEQEKAAAAGPAQLAPVGAGVPGQAIPAIDLIGGDQAGQATLEPPPLIEDFPKALDVAVAMAEKLLELGRLFSHGAQ